MHIYCSDFRSSKNYCRLNWQDLKKKKTSFRTMLKRNFWEIPQISLSFLLNFSHLSVPTVLKLTHWAQDAKQEISFYSRWRYKSSKNERKNIQKLCFFWRFRQGYSVISSFSPFQMPWVCGRSMDNPYLSRNLQHYDTCDIQPACSRVLASPPPS